ncbi:MAG: LacI family DNA-binding transcriptional regulator [Gammaproteobacteria bacterium]
MPNQLVETTSTRPTIGDVAQAAGVSTKTVSRVFNGEPNVRESTRERVQKVIDTLDYEPNPYAQYLGSMRALKAAGGANA